MKTMRQQHERTIPEEDLEFLDKFVQCTLSKTCWSHEAHVRMAWLQMERSTSFDEALERIRDGIMTFNASVQSVGYHETITVAFARLIHSKRAKTASTNWQEFLNQHPDLLSKNCLLEFYRAETLATDEARTNFVAPDVKPLPEAH